MIVLALDTETTGLIPNLSASDLVLPEVVEVYAGLFDLAKGGELIKEINSLVKPTRGIDEAGKAASVHKITNAMVKNAPLFAEIAVPLKKLIEASPIVAGHNVTFDKEIVTIEMARCKQQVTWPRLLCTVEQTVHLKSHRLSLAALHEIMVGQPWTGAHRAKADVLALVRCLVKMLEKDML